MATVTWNPPASVWTAVPAESVLAATTISATVTADPTDVSVPTIKSYSASVSPSVPPGLVLAVSASGVTVSAPGTLSDAFPNIDIEYQIKRVEHHCTLWSQVPEEADEIIRFIPYPSNTKTWTLTVTATLSDKTTDSITYAFTVEKDYTPGKIALQEAVDARR